MKSLLIVTDAFPPLGGAGIKRILKFVKFLPESGWSCTILTAANERFLPLDPSLLGEVPQGTEVHRTYTLESLFKSRGSTTQIAGAASPRPSHSQRGGIRSILHAIYKGLGQFFKIPDSRILWLPTAVCRGVRLCRRHKHDAILATGPSFTNFLIGACIRSLTGTPLLLDVRDAWVADPTRIFTRGYLRNLDRRLEAFAFRRADRVVTTNPFVTADFIRRYESLTAANCDTIFNGFDRDDFDFPVATKTSASGPFRIVHTGRLYAERTPKHFLDALGRAIRLRPEIQDCLKVQFVGSCEVFDDGRSIEDYIAENKLTHVVELVGRVSRKRSLQYQMEADLLLLIIGIVPPQMALTYGISGKLFDYAVCDKGILTLASEGSTRELIATNHLGDLFAHEDIDGVCNYLLRCIDLHRAGERMTGPRPEYLTPFDCRTLSRRLGAHLDQLSEIRKGQASALQLSTP